MNNKAIHKDAKTPDQLQHGLQEGFIWTTKHSQLVLGIGIALLALGGIFAGMNAYSVKKETALQEKYFSLEKKYLDKKTAFDEAAKPQVPENKKDAKTKQPEPAAKKTAATGQLDTDYGTLVSDFESIIQESPSSKAAAMAALNAAELLVKYNQQPKALEILSKVSSQAKPKDLVSSLVYSAQANLLADSGDCKAAQANWQKIVDSKHLEFMQSEIKLKMGLCFGQLNDQASAEKIFSELATSPSTKDTEAGKDAAKFLRVMKIK